MGNLRDLTRDGELVHLVLSNSGLADIFIYDELKQTYGITLESVYNIESKGDFKDMLELVNIQPYLSSKWLFVINYTKVKGLCKKHKGMFGIDTSCFLVKVKNYREYKEFKELVQDCNDLYVPILRKDDIMYLLQDYKLSEKILKFIISSYSRDAEKIFTLREKLSLGYEVKSNRDVVKLLGTSTGSINKFVFSLLNTPPSTSRGEVQVYKKRVQMAKDLANAYGVSTFKNFITASARDILYIKMLYEQGIIFKSVRDIPDCFDEKKLSKYNIYLERIENEIPCSRVLKLYCMLKSSGRWYSEMDMLDFLYKYYGGVK